MSVRISLAALAALALTGCDLPGQKPKAAAAAPVAQASRDCCCKVCSTDSAPSDDVAASGDTRSAGRAATRQVAHKPARAQVSREAASSRTYTTASRSQSSQTREYARPDRQEVLAGGSYDRRDDGGSEDGYGQRYSERSAGRYAEADGRYGGRYGSSGRAVSGVSVSVEESESFSERRRYSESSSRYGSRGDVVSGSSYGHSTALYYEDRDGRVRRGGPAGTDRAGYLTWPGKVED